MAAKTVQVAISMEQDLVGGRFVRGGTIIGLRSAYEALDTIIRDHFFDFVASVVLPVSEEII